MIVPDEFIIKLQKMSRIQFYDLWCELNEDKLCANEDYEEVDWGEQSKPFKKLCINAYANRMKSSNLERYYLYDKAFNKPKTRSRGTQTEEV